MRVYDKLERMLDLCVLSNEGGVGQYEDKEENEFHNLIKECSSALKLQELVKKVKLDTDMLMRDWIDSPEELERVQNLLNYLVDESEKNPV